MSTGTRQLSARDRFVLQTEAKPMRYARYASHSDRNGDTDIDDHADPSPSTRMRPDTLRRDLCVNLPRQLSSSGVIVTTLAMSIAVATGAGAGSMPKRRIPVTNTKIDDGDSQDLTNRFDRGRT